LGDTVAGIAFPDRELELIEELQEGSERAFEILITLYQEPIYNFVFRLLEDPADAPDVTQEVFLKVFRNIRKFRGDSSLKTWIYRIAVHEASNLRRWFWRHSREEFSLDELGARSVRWLDRLADPQQTQYERVLRRERRQAVETALAGVKECFRAAVVLRDIEGLSYEEIAEILQVSLGTVKSRILRGREALKQRLEPLVAASGTRCCVLETVK
jgi:RNA polymerase sigma-70 factor (ECF subfamily)